PLSFGCSCSRERVASMLQSLGEEEARAAAEATGEVEVRCEFCGREYHFPLTALDVLFNEAQPSQEAPERLQ
ncbi:Hsp33 family molecular chaperone HslO, partial [Xanthomonas perforans]